MAQQKWHTGGENFKFLIQLQSKPYIMDYFKGLFLAKKSKILGQDLKET